MTKEEIAWASRHDWFRGGFGGVVAVDATETWRDQQTGRLMVETKTELFDDYRRLRCWAGY